MFWQLQAIPTDPNGPQQRQDHDGDMVPLIMLDDSNGDIYVGGQNMSKTCWIPSGANGLAPETPQATSDPTVFSLVGRPRLLMLWAGGLYQTPGPGNDFVLNKGTPLSTGTTSGKVFGWEFVCNGTTAVQAGAATAAM